MADPYVTREFTVRDLLTHRSGLGLGAGDLLFVTNTDFTRQDVVRALRHLKPVTSFRSQFAYDNLLYVVAGEVVAVASGKSWEDFVSDAAARAAGHDGLRGFGRAICAINPTSRRPIRWSKASSDDRRAAGSCAGRDRRAPFNAVSTAWRNGSVNAQLAHGKAADGTTAIQRCAERGNVDAADDPDASKGKEAELTRSHFAWRMDLGWGLGGLRRLQARLRTMAACRAWSLTSAWLPELNLGVVVLTNQQEDLALTVISHHRYWKPTPAPLRMIGSRWRAPPTRSAPRPISQGRSGDRARLPRPHRSNWAAYAGKFADPWRGACGHHPGWQRACG